MVRKIEGTGFVRFELPHTVLLNCLHCGVSGQLSGFGLPVSRARYDNLIGRIDY